MKKLYTLSLLLVGALTSAQPIITGIMDGDCNGGNPKVLEIYANGTVDFFNFTLQNQTNATAGAFGTDLNLGFFQTRTNEFVYVILGGTPGATVGDPNPIPNEQRFALEFPGIPMSSVFTPPTGTPSASFPQPMNVNGDDRVRIINASTLEVVDQFGESDVDGTGTAWEYLDSWAKRNNGTGPDGATFNAANWTFGGVAALDTLGACQGGASYSTLVPFGTYQLGTESFNIAGLKVYPNPVTNGNLYITSNSSAAKTVVIYDIVGKQVVNTTVTDAPVNVANLNSGVYIVKITEEGKSATRKLVIQ